MFKNMLGDVNLKADRSLHDCVDKLVGGIGLISNCFSGGLPATDLIQEIYKKSDNFVSSIDNATSVFSGASMFQNLDTSLIPAISLVCFSYGCYNYIKKKESKYLVIIIVSLIFIYKFFPPAYTEWLKRQSKIFSLVPIADFGPDAFEVQGFMDDFDLDMKSVGGIIAASMLALSTIGKPLRNATSIFNALSSCKDIPRITAGITATFEHIVHWFEAIVNYIRLKFMGLKAIHFLSDFDPKVKLWISKVDDICLEAHKRQLVTNTTNSDRIYTLICQGLEMISSIRSWDKAKKLRESIATYMSALRVLEKQFDQFNVGVDGVRMEPLIVCLRGASGVGKSAMTHPLLLKLLSRVLDVEDLGNFKVNHSDFIYPRQHEHQYWDGYHGQFVTVFDDFGQVRDTQGVSDNEYMDMIRCGNLFMNRLHMAHLEAKGVTTFRSKIILCSTNMQRFTPVSIVEPEALERRFDIVADVCPKQEYCLEESLVSGEIWARRLDPEKVGQHIDLNVCEFHLFSFHTKQYYGKTDFEGFIDKCVGKFKYKFEKARVFSQDLQQIKELAISQRADAIVQMNMYGDEIKEWATGANRDGVVDKDFEKFQDWQAQDLEDPRSVAEPSDPSTVTLAELFSANSIEPQDSETYMKVCKALGEDRDRSNFALFSLVTLFETEGYNFTKDTFRRFVFHYERALGPSTVDFNTCFRAINLLITHYGLEFLGDADHCSIVTIDSSLYHRLKTTSRRIFEFLKSYVPTMETMKKVLAGLAVLLSMFGLVKIGIRILEGISPGIFGKKVDETKAIDSNQEYTFDELYDAKFEGALKDFRDKQEKNGDFEKLLLSNSNTVGLNLAEERYLLDRPVEKFVSRLKNNQRHRLDDRTVGAVYAVPTAYKHQVLFFDASHMKDNFEYENIGESNGRATYVGPLEDAPLYGLESTIEGDSGGKGKGKKNNQKNKAERLKGLSADSWVVEGGVDSACDSIFNKIFIRSLYDLVLPDMEKRCGLVLFVRGHVALMPKHFVNMIRDKLDDGVYTPETKFTLRKMGSLQLFEVPIFSFVRNCKQTTCLQGLDLCLVKFPATLPIHPDIIKFFQSGSNFQSGRTYDCRLLIPKNNIPIAWNLKSVAMCDKRVGSSAGVHVLNQYLQYKAATTVGDCGGVLLEVNSVTRSKKIMGIHTAGNPNGFGISSHLGEEDLRACFDSFFPSEIVLEEHPQDVVQMLEPFNGRFTKVGNIDRPIFRPYGSKIIKSPLYGIWMQAKTAPALLIGSEKRGLPDPMIAAVDKYCLNTLFLDNNLLVDCGAHLLSTIVNSCLDYVHSKPRLYSFEESILGIPGVDFCDAIPRNTSAGYPYVHDARFKDSGKYSFFGRAEEYSLSGDLCGELKQRVMNLIESSGEGKRVSCIFMDFLKDERRSLEKVSAGKTRLISCCPLDLTIATRMYFLDFSVYCMNNRIANGMASGINVYSSEWHALYTRLLSVGPHIIAGDFKGYDGCGNVLIFSQLCDVVNRWYDDGPVNCKIRETLISYLYNSVHVNGTVVYEWPGSMPSGHPLTTLFNSMANLMLIRMCWVTVFKDSCALSSFNDFVFAQVLGDDNLISVSPHIADRFNHFSISDGMMLFGFKYTSDTKDVVDLPYKGIQEVTFLKRKFRYERLADRFIAPLDLDVILEIPFWTKKGSLSEKIVLDNFDNMLLELAMHDQVEFERVKEMGKHVREILNYIPFSLERRPWLHKALNSIEIW